MPNTASVIDATIPMIENPQFDPQFVAKMQEHVFKAMAEATKSNTGM